MLCKFFVSRIDQKSIEQIQLHLRHPVRLNDAWSWQFRVCNPVGRDCVCLWVCVYLCVCKRIKTQNGTETLIPTGHLQPDNQTNPFHLEYLHLFFLFNQYTLCFHSIYADLPNRKINSSDWRLGWGVSHLILWNWFSDYRAPYIF